MKTKIQPLVPVSREGLEEAAKALLEGKFLNEQIPLQGISTKGDSWEIKGVNYRNGIHNLRVSYWRISHKLLLIAFYAVNYLGSVEGIGSFNKVVAFHTCADYRKWVSWCG